jgi:hypothetical protein
MRVTGNAMSSSRDFAAHAAKIGYYTANGPPCQQMPWSAAKQAGFVDVGFGFFAINAAFPD